MTYQALNYDNGMARCPVEGCAWSVPKGREMSWPDHRDEYHDGI